MTAKSVLRASRRHFLMGASATLLSPVASYAQQNSNAPEDMVFPGAEKLVARTVMVPMRDGVHLATDIYEPKGHGPWPVVLQRTPYGRQQPYIYGLYAYLVEAGFTLVVQDNRGRFDSEGEYRPFVDDGRDGYDTIEWVAAQSWATDKVGMIGMSAMGIAAYLAAMETPPHLAAGAVMVARNPNQTASRFPGGLYLENGAGEWSKTVGVAGGAMAVPKIAALDDDDRRMDIRQYDEKISVPFIHLGGWYDIHLQSTLDNFANFQTKAAGPARGNQKLIMAASSHMGAVEGLVFPHDPGAPPFIPPELVVRWFEYWLKGVENGVMAEPPVRYYLMGDTFDPAAPGNAWRQDTQWPPATHPLDLYLSGDGTLQHSGAAEMASQTYVYDPNDPITTVGGNNLSMASGPLDQRPVSSRPDVLRFVSDPLEAPLEIVGRITADLWVSTDAADTDFIVKLIDIHPDGFEALVRDQGLRLRHRNGGYTQTRVEKDQPYQITVDLWSTALVLNKGHRLGILVQSSNWPRFERHTNTWDPVANYGAAVTAHNTIYTGGARASKVTLPIVSPR